MQATCERRAEVGEYYRIAPMMVRRIDACENAERLWRDLAEAYIVPCVRFTERGNPAVAHQFYRAMVNQLKARFPDTSETDP